MAEDRAPRSVSTGGEARRICLITGGTGGIGFAAARGLACAKMELILVGRSAARGAEAVAQIDALAGCPAATFLQADLSSQAEARRRAEHVRGRWPPVDVLVHSAGTGQQRRRESVDGVELTWAVNQLAPFLLTHLLLESLVMRAPGQIILVSSRSHRWGRIHWADPELHHGYNLLRAYGQSKLANILFARELNRRLSDRGVTATAVHPGLVRTGIARDVWGLAAVVWRSYAYLLGQSAQNGAEPIVHAVTEADPADWGGLYVGPHGPERASRRAGSMEDAARLWDLCVQRLGLPAG
ncbi:MAG: SDR family NAD(P)-dependent oxidoreductase [Anaerolineae bacterium]